MADSSKETSKKKNIVKLVEIIGIKQLAVQAFNASLESIRASDPEIVEILIKEIKIEELAGELFIYAYDKYFSDTEIEEIIQFYQSPVGEKMISLGPQIFQEVRVMAEMRVKKQLEKYQDERLTSFDYFT